MAELTEKFLKVVDPDGSAHLIPDNKGSRKMIEKLNALIKKGKRYQIVAYDPNNPDAPVENVSTTDAIGKLALENQQMKRKLEEMEKALAASKSADKVPSSKTTTKP